LAGGSPRCLTTRQGRWAPPAPAEAAGSKNNAVALLSRQRRTGSHLLEAVQLRNPSAPRTTTIAATMFLRSRHQLVANSPPRSRTFPPAAHLSRPNPRSRSLTAQAHASASRPHDTPSTLVLTQRRRRHPTASSLASVVRVTTRLRRRPAPTAPPAAAAAASSPFGCSSRAPVIEYLLLITARPDADPDELLEGIETVWSLQYMVPGAGVICASAGRVLVGGGGGSQSDDRHDLEPRPATPPTSTGTRTGTSGLPSAAAAKPIEARPLSHVVHFRLANRAALERFVSHPLFAQTLKDTLGPLTVAGGADSAAVATATAATAAAADDDARNNITDRQKGYAELVFEGCAGRALEPMFRRGPDFEQPGGVEQLWLLGSSGEDRGGDRGADRGGGDRGAGSAGDASAAASFLSRLGELAESSAAGAVQATFGPVIAASPPSALTHVLMARFAGLGQAAAFAALPPCAAISGGGRAGRADASAGRADASAARSLPLLARRRVLVRAGKLDDEAESDDQNL